MPSPSISLGSASSHILPSNQNAVDQGASPTLPHRATTPNAFSSAAVTGLSEDNTDVGVGPVPIRHPRPLTAADLHLQLEREQEAVVNRLTRELSMLRAAQNASVVSHTSSTSVGLSNSADHNAKHLPGSSHYPASNRVHHRSSSSTSGRSITTPGSSINTIGATAEISASGLAAERSRASPFTRQDAGTISSPSLSRQNSTVGSRRSGTSSPAQLYSAQSSYQLDPIAVQPQRERLPAPHGESAHAPRTSVTTVQGTGRYEETVYHRHQLETVKKENDMLKRRIRELERTLSEKRLESSTSFVDRTSSDSVSAAVSVNMRMGNVTDTLSSVASRGRERDKDRDGEAEVARLQES